MTGRLAVVVEPSTISRNAAEDSSGEGFSPVHTTQLGRSERLCGTMNDSPERTEIHRLRIRNSDRMIALIRYMNPATPLLQLHLTTTFNTSHATER